MASREPLASVRRTVARATRPVLAPLRLAGHVVERVAPERSTDTSSPDLASAPAEKRMATGRELEELRAMRDADGVEDRAERAARSSSAYLAARRRRLKRELEECEG